MKDYPKASSTMPRQRSRRDPKVVPEPAEPAREVTPLFVCPGMKDEMLPYALFPYGDGISRARACPGRSSCLWFAGHDLGGRDSICEFPDAAILTASFRPHPFFCPNFQKHRARPSKDSVGSNDDAGG